MKPTIVATLLIAALAASGATAVSNSTPSGKLHNAIVQRDDWKAAEVYTVFMSLIQAGDLKGDLQKDLADILKGRKSTTEGYRMLSELKALLPENVYREVLNMVFMNANGTVPVAVGSPNTNGFLQDPRERRNPVPVTPDPISPQN